MRWAAIIEKLRDPVASSRVAQASKIVSVQVGPVAGDLDVGLVDEPSIGGSMPTRAGGANELARELVSLERSQTSS